MGRRILDLNYSFSPFLWSFGGDYLTPDNKKSALNTPEANEAFKYFIELYTKYKVMPPGVPTMNAQDVRTQVAHRKTAMEIGSGWSAPIINAINPELKAFDVLAAAPLPMKKKRVTTIWLSSWVIFRIMPKSMSSCVLSRHSSLQGPSLSSFQRHRS